MIRALLTLATCSMVPTLSAAQDVNYYAGVAFTSNYISNGVTQTQDGPAIQPYFEVESQGFYAGIWASNVDLGNSDNAEIDLYLGYRTGLFNDRLGIDIGYARYFYNDSGDCCGELKFNALYELVPDLGVEAYFAYDTEAEVLNSRATLAYKVNDQLALSGVWGKINNNREYWHAGGSYAFNGSVSLDVRYHGSTAGDPGLVATLSFATSQDTLRRLFGNQAQR
ncbi:MAG: TorF family putative porin [Paracoccaceae bacterium]